MNLAHHLRETLAFHDGLADFAFAMQGLGSGAITLAGKPEQKARYLPRVARGEAIAAFALSEADAGSDVAAMHAAASNRARSSSACIARFAHCAFTKARRKCRS